MTKKQKIIAASLGLISVFVALAYVQVNKALSYVLTFKKYVVNKISPSIIDVDVYLGLNNTSKLKYKITEIAADIYINGIFITKLRNYNEQIILPDTTSSLSMNLKLKPTEVAEKLKTDAAALLLYPDKIILKYDLFLKVRYGILSFTIPYTQKLSLAELKKAS